MPQSFVHSSATGQPNSTVPSGTRNDSRTPEQSRKGSPIPTSNDVSDATYPARSDATKEGLKALNISPQVFSSGPTSVFARMKADSAKKLLITHRKYFPRDNKPKLEEQSPKCQLPIAMRIDLHPRYRKSWRGRSTVRLSRNNRDHRPTTSRPIYRFNNVPKTMHTVVRARNANASGTLSVMTQRDKMLDSREQGGGRGNDRKGNGDTGRFGGQAMMCHM
jgi:hypothetical protein